MQRIILIAFAFFSKVFLRFGRWYQSHMSYFSLLFMKSYTFFIWTMVRIDRTEPMKIAGSFLCDEYDLGSCKMQIQVIQRYKKDWYVKETRLTCYTVSWPRYSCRIFCIRFKVGEGGGRDLDIVNYRTICWFGDSYTVSSISIPYGV